jgi:hypothetical protein
MAGKQFSVSRESEEKRDEHGQQKTERGTGRPMWTTQLFVQDSDGGEVVTVTTAGERPTVRVGTTVVPVQLEALPWAQTRNGTQRNGVAYRATELKVQAAAKAA